MIILYCLLTLVAVIELATFLTYGGFVSKQTTNVYMNLDEKELSLNMFNSAILSTNCCFIANVPLSIFSKYYIDGQGTVPRWSKLHKRINEYYAIALKNGYDRYE